LLELIRGYDYGEFDGMKKIQKMLNSNLGPETGYPEYGFLGFPVPQGNARIVPLLRPQQLPSIAFPIYYSFIIQLHDVLPQL
jgi:hypothetical protein